MQASRGVRAGTAWFRTAAMVVLAMVWGVPPATAQMSPEEEQRCVWQCLANSPGAASAEYDSCVQERCVAQPRAEQPPVSPAPASPTPRAAWTSGAGKGGAHYAGVEIPGRSFSYLCKRGGPGLLAIAGLSRRADAIGLRIDQQDYGLNFVAQNGILYTDAPAGSHLLRALLGGKAVHVTDQRSGANATFPLSGSGAAIRKALAGCGLAS
jgi:hypothetical protein